MAPQPLADFGTAGIITDVISQQQARHAERVKDGRHHRAALSRVIGMTRGPSMRSYCTASTFAHDGWSRSITTGRPSGGADAS